MDELSLWQRLRLLALLDSLQESKRVSPNQFFVAERHVGKSFIDKSFDSLRDVGTALGFQLSVQGATSDDGLDSGIEVEFRGVKSAVSLEDLRAELNSLPVVLQAPSEHERRSKLLSAEQQELREMQLMAGEQPTTEGEADCTPLWQPSFPTGACTFPQEMAHRSLESCLTELFTKHINPSSPLETLKALKLPNIFPDFDSQELACTTQGASYETLPFGGFVRVFYDQILSHLRQCVGLVDSASTEEADSKAALLLAALVSDSRKRGSESRLKLPLSILEQLALYAKGTPFSDSFCSLRLKVECAHLSPEVPSVEDDTQQPGEDDEAFERRIFAKLMRGPPSYLGEFVDWIALVKKNRNDHSE